MLFCGVQAMLERALRHVPFVLLAVGLQVASAQASERRMTQGPCILHSLG